MNFVKLTRIYSRHNGSRTETCYSEIWIDTFQIYQVEISVNGFARVHLKPIITGSTGDLIEIISESIPVLEEALKKHTLLW